jgi:hypothetical protein
MMALDQKLTVYFVVPCMIAVVESYIRSLTIGDHVEYNSTASIGIYKNHNVIYTASYVPQQTFLKKKCNIPAHQYFGFGPLQPKSSGLMGLLSHWLRQSIAPLVNSFTLWLG